MLEFLDRRGEWAHPPTPDERVIALNRALNDEVRRHAATRVRNIQLLLFCMTQSQLQPTEVERIVEKEVERIVEKEVEKVVVVERIVVKREWRARGDPHIRGDVTRRPERSRIPIEVARRTGLAAVIQRPLRLRSGVCIEPERRAATRGDQIAVFGDASWLALGALVERQGVVSSVRDLNGLIFDGKAASATIRSAIQRARQAITYVGGRADDIETEETGAGWRLMLAGGEQ